MTVSRFSPKSTPPSEVPSAEQPISELLLAELQRMRSATVLRVTGPRRYRRRLMELGLVPGVTVCIVNVAPLGDPLEVEVRHCRLSLRRAEAALIHVLPEPPSRRSLQVLP